MSECRKVMCASIVQAEACSYSLPVHAAAARCTSQSPTCMQDAMQQLRTELDAARDTARTYEHALHRLEARAAELSVRESAQEQARVLVEAENAQLRDALRSKLDLGTNSKVRVLNRMTEL